MQGLVNHIQFGVWVASGRGVGRSVRRVGVGLPAKKGPSVVPTVV